MNRCVPAILAGRSDTGLARPKADGRLTTPLQPLDCQCRMA